MTRNKEYNKHFIALVSVFILGDSVITLPSGSKGQFTFFGFSVALVAALILISAEIFVLKYVFKPEFPAVFQKILFSAVAVYALYGSAKCFIRYMSFVSEILLAGTKRFFIVLLFVGLLFFLFSKSNEVLLKLSLLSLCLSVLAIVIFFVLSVKDFKLHNIAIYYLPDFKTAAVATAPFFKNVTLPILLIPFISAANLNRLDYKTCLTGATAGGILAGLCFFDSIALFGAKLASRLNYPLFSAVSTVTIGPLFTRMDATVYFLFLSSALIKQAVLLKLISALLNKIKE